MDYKQFAQDAYKDNKKIKNLPSGYYLDDKLSNDKSKVFINPDKREVILSFRGTQDKHDILTDITAIGFGDKKHNKQFQNATNKLNKIHDMYPEYDSIVVGHSLGGSLSEYANKNAKNKATKVITYNKGTAIPDYFEKRASNQTDIRRDGDIISVASKYQGGGKYKEKKMNLKDPHSIKNV